MTQTSVASQACTKWVISDQGPRRTLWPGRSVTFLDEDKFLLKPIIPLSCVLVFLLSNILCPLPTNHKLTKLWNWNDRNGCHPMTQPGSSSASSSDSLPIVCLVVIAGKLLGFTPPCQSILNRPSVIGMTRTQSSFFFFWLTPPRLVFIAHSLLAFPNVTTLFLPAWLKPFQSNANQPNCDIGMTRMQPRFFFWLTALVLSSLHACCLIFPNIFLLGSNPSNQYPIFHVPSNWPEGSIACSDSSSTGLQRPRQWGASLSDSIIPIWVAIARFHDFQMFHNVFNVFQYAYKLQCCTLAWFS